jgi:tyrosinase
MGKPRSGFGRRTFLGTMAAASFAGFFAWPASAAAGHRRYSVNCPEGEKMLASFAKGINAMLQLPPDDARN